MEKCTGPRTEPWGTPQMEERTEEQEEPARTELDFSDRYEFSQLWAEPMTPKLLEGRLRRIE